MNLFLLKCTGYTVKKVTSLKYFASLCPWEQILSFRVDLLSEGPLAHLVHFLLFLKMTRETTFGFLFTFLYTNSFIKEDFVIETRDNLHELSRAIFWQK